GLFLREEALMRGAELVLRAERALADATTASCLDAGLGRAHQRVLLVIACNPGLSVSDLQHLLRIRKQSLGRVLDALVARGLVARERDSRDRRRHLLSLTAAGNELERSLFAAMRERIAAAYRRAGPDQVSGFWNVLAVLAGDTDSG
ncbi:MAG: MarR family transcriptional regulator, partial [Alphaproteobacteria bacterium]